MISVCVPVYNTDVRSLARQLAAQASLLDIPVELLFFDDCSDEPCREVNREISSFGGIIYRECPENMGRSAIRNLLGKTAGYPWLLFLDADSLPAGESFLQNYAAETARKEVICGGTRYPDDPPAREMLLRWTYGKAREQLTAEQRSKRNRFAITANNFMVRKETLTRIPFRETIKDYGHEDTLLGYDLSRAAIEIRHIDNPVFHTGLEPPDIFLEKTRMAVGNLFYITEEILPDPRFRQESGLLRSREKLRKMGLLRWAGRLFGVTEPWLRKNLTGPRPRLVLFDLYRLGYLCSISQNQRNQGQG